MPHSPFAGQPEWLSALATSDLLPGQRSSEAALLQLGVVYEQDPRATQVALAAVGETARSACAEQCRHLLSATCSERALALASRPAPELLQLPWPLWDSPRLAHAAQTWSLDLLAGRERTERLLAAHAALTGGDDEALVDAATADDSALLAIAVSPALIAPRLRVAASLPGELLPSRWWWTADASALGEPVEDSADLDADTELAAAATWVIRATPHADDLGPLRLSPAEADALLATKAGRELADLLDDVLHWPAMPADQWTARPRQADPARRQPRLAEPSFRQRWQSSQQGRLAAAADAIVQLGGIALARFQPGVVGVLDQIGLVAMGLAEDTESDQPIASWLVLPQTGLAQLRLDQTELPVQGGPILLRFAGEVLPLAACSADQWTIAKVACASESDRAEPLMQWLDAVFLGDRAAAIAALDLVSRAHPQVGPALLSALRAAQQDVFGSTAAGG